MKLKQVHRTATFAWSPFDPVPTFVTGTVSGALDASFSNDSQLEIWTLDLLNKNEFDLGSDEKTGPNGVVTTNSRFNRVAWSQPVSGRGRGVIAAAMESGELGLWDPEKMCMGTAVDSLIIRNTTHQGSVRGLDFNPIASNILASGAIDGEIFVWDLKDPSKPYSPGPRSSKLDEITALAWNHQVQHVLASSSSTGYTVVWDLKSKREVVSLAYGGGAGTMAGMSMTGRGLGVGGRRGMSDVAWHPGNATRLVTASEDDNSPVIMMWDLRNARAPEKILTGHEKGVLSLSWCKQDADLLLSCGKDNRALCWNPQTSEIIGELPTADNWAFQVQWCPRNPDLLATAYFDGTVGVHSLQSTNEIADAVPVAPQADGSDIFDVASYRSSQPTLSLKQPPKWLRRPVSCSFGYGGKLITISNLPSASGKHQSGSVHVRSVVTEPTIVQRVKQLEAAEESKTFNTFAQEKSKSDDTVDVASWKALLSLYRADSREQLITLLGFSKSEIAAQIATAVDTVKVGVLSSQDYEADIADAKPHEPVVTFAEPTHDDVQDSEFVPDSEAENDELAPSEMSVGATSDTTDVTRAMDGESQTTAPSLFGDDVAINTPQGGTGADFFSSMGTIRDTHDDDVLVPHTNYPHDSSVAATIGSRPSSAASEVVKSNTFKIHPSEESEVDRLLTQALVLGDFESAVSLCLSADRFADAILLAVKGGPDLLVRTQKAYFEKRTSSLPYLRLFQSIATDDLEDIVQNAVLQEWREIFVVICTFAKADEFASLAEQLGQRLEFQGNVARAADTPGAEEYRKNATLTYLAAGALEKVVNIWIEEMTEEENRHIEDIGREGSSRYSAHAHALQSFIEKVTVFRDATKYDDVDLKDAARTPETTGVRSYKLAGLYDRYFEYADLLAAQGLVSQAIKFLNFAPPDYQGPRGSDVDFMVARERLLAAAGHKSPSSSYVQQTNAAALPAASSHTVAQPTSYNYPHYAPSNASQAPVAPGMVPAYPSYNPPPAAPADNPYVPAHLASTLQGQYQPTVSTQPYAQNEFASTGYQQQYQPQSYQPQQSLPPSGSINAAQTAQALPPPPKRKENGGWNDAPAVADRRTPAQALSMNKPNAITSPFANAPPSAAPASPFLPGQPSPLPPPPTRPGSVQSRSSPIMQGPPPRAPVGPPQAPTQSRFAPGVQASGQQQYVPPPGRVMSPGQLGAQRGPLGAPPGPGTHPSAYMRGTPPPGQPTSYAREPSHLGPPSARGVSGPPSQQLGQYAPPNGQQAGPYAPASNQPSGPYAPPTGQYTPSQGHDAGPYAPPPGIGRSGPPPPPHSGFGQPQNGPRQPPPGRGIVQGGPPANAGPPPPSKGPPPPKYPPGDRSHIPDNARHSYEILTQECNRLKQTAPPQQHRMVEDTERRLNVLFDALNCETLTPEIVAQLAELTEALAARDQPRALAIHVDLLTKGSRTNDIGLWMSAVKLLIMRS